MNARELLEDVKKSLWAIQNMEKTIRELDDMVVISGINYEAERISSSPRQDKMELTAIKHADKMDNVKKELQQMVVHYAEVKKIALFFISLLDSEDQKEVLRMRYLEGMKWWEILEARCCDSLPTQMRLRDRAIEELQKQIEKYPLGSK